MSTIDRFDNDVTVTALANGGDRAILCALAHTEYEGVRDAWSVAVNDTWDEGDPYGSAMSALGVVVDILSAYESPEWGNVSGRYESTGHRLTGEDWHALDSGSFPEDGTVGTLDTPDLWGMQGLATYAGEDDRNVAHVVQLGDMLSQVIDRCGEDGSGY